MEKIVSIQILDLEAENEEKLQVFACSMSDEDDFHAILTVDRLAEKAKEFLIGEDEDLREMSNVNGHKGLKIMKCPLLQKSREADLSGWYCAYCQKGKKNQNCPDCVGEELVGLNYGRLVCPACENIYSVCPACGKLKTGDTCECGGG